MLSDKSISQGLSCSMVPFLNGQGYTVSSPARDRSVPPLFNIYVNDLSSVVDSQTLMFTDDTKRIQSIKQF